MIKAGLLCGLALAASAAFVQAQPLPLPLPIPPFLDMRGSPEDQRACQPDAVRLCREVLNGGDMAVLSCFQQRRQYLSPACEAVLRRHGQ
jgi:hypothetical protein